MFPSRLNASPDSLKQSILRVHPLAALAKQERPAFYRQLTPDQKAVIKRAEAWYLDTFVRSRPRKGGMSEKPFLKRYF